MCVCRSAAPDDGLSLCGWYELLCFLASVSRLASSLGFHRSRPTEQSDHTPFAPRSKHRWSATPEPLESLSKHRFVARQKASQTSPRREAHHRTARVARRFGLPRRNALRFARTYSSYTTQLGQPIGSPTSVPERRNAEPRHRVAAARVTTLAARRTVVLGAALLRHNKHHGRYHPRKKRRPRQIGTRVHGRPVDTV